MESILARRSVRRYTDRPVPEEVVQGLLRAAMSAPSAHNQRPWQFVVIRERRLLDSIPEFHPYSKMLREAPLAIVVCGDLRGLKDADFWAQDCAAATENLLIAIQAQGLGGVWCGVYPKHNLVEGFSRLLELPDYIIPFALVSLGYPAETKPAGDRYEARRVHYDRW